MSIGKQHSVLRRNPVARILASLLGAADPHSHFRTAPLRRAFRNLYMNKSATVLEIGCGAGHNLFMINELMRRSDISYVGFDLNADAIANAEKVRALIGAHNIKFYNKDCARLAEPPAADVVLLIDFLEHVRDPGGVLRDIRSSLNPGGKLLVSVPTHRYPGVFGRKFHEAVGHVRDGFNISEVQGLLNEAGYQIDSFSYNTGLVASLVCRIYYRYLRNAGRWVAAMSGFALSIFRFADVLNGESRSCSLFVVASAR